MTYLKGSLNAEAPKPRPVSFLTYIGAACYRVYNIGNAGFRLVKV